MLLFHVCLGRTAVGQALVAVSHLAAALVFVLSLAVQVLLPASSPSASASMVLRRFSRTKLRVWIWQEAPFFHFTRPHNRATTKNRFPAI
jgi:hypothetical protein